MGVLPQASGLNHVVSGHTRATMGPSTTTPHRFWKATPVADAWTPTPGTQWPPTGYRHLWAPMRVWDAWWTGNTDLLTDSIDEANAYPNAHPSQFRGGVVGTMARAWWGRPQRQGDRPSRNPLHLPIASDLARTSADLLFSDPPTVQSSDKRAQALIDAMTDDGLMEAMHQAAEMASALGGVYLRVTVDPGINDGRPFITAHGPDEVIPTFTWGHLTAATVVDTITDQDRPGTVWRHLESHTLDRAGYGHIAHTLYAGTWDNIGNIVPLTERPETAGLQVNAQAEWDGPLTPGLAVAYMPNMLPQRMWRKDPVGRHYGRPDIEGLESMMDALDEAWSSWMRDLRLGKARIVAASSILEDGRTSADPLLFDLDREVFTPVETLDRGEGLPIQQVQFNIRVAEHQTTVSALLEQIINQAGYSIGSFQEQAGGTVTATEVKAREKRTLTTRARKVTHATRALKTLVSKAVAYAGLGDAPELTVTFPETVSENPLDQASAIAQLNSASVMSRETAVRLVNPDWDDADVKDELDRIEQDKKDSMSLVDPTMWHPSTDTATTASATPTPAMPAASESSGDSAQPTIDGRTRR